jgi:excisionase family DNA binding protein
MSTTTAPNRLLVTVREAAKMLGISERTLWTMTSPRGSIPSIRIGRAVRYNLDSLRQWAAEEEQR